MSTRAEAIEYLQTKVKDDEPVFILRGQDKTAWVSVSDWAIRNAHRLGHDHPKIRGAEACSDVMMDYSDRCGKLPD